MWRWLKGLLLGVVTGLSGAVFAISPLGLTFEENVGLAWLFNVRGPIEPPSDMVVVSLDQKTAEHFGYSHRSSKWPRTLYAEVVDTLVDHGASVIVFDMKFETASTEAEDAVFAASVARSRRVVLFQPSEIRKQDLRQGSGKSGGGDGGGGDDWMWIETLVSPIPVLSDAARALAPFPLPKTSAKVSRFWSFKASFDDAPTLPIAALQLHALRHHDLWLQRLARAGTPDVDQLPQTADELDNAIAVRRYMRSMRQLFREDAGLIERFVTTVADNGSSQSPATENGVLDALVRAYAGQNSYVINFYGPPAQVRTIPFYRLLGDAGSGGRAADFDLDGKCVFVGISELDTPEQPDSFYTVFSGEDGIDISGVEIVATAFGNILTDRTISPTKNYETFFILLALGVVVGIIAYLLPAVIAVSAAMIFVGAYGVAAQLWFNGGDIWVPLATPVLIQLPFALLVGVVGQYLLARRQRALATDAVRFFVPDEVAKALTEKSLDPTTLNQDVYAACLASDAQGYTEFAEALTPKALGTFMKDYFDTLVKAMRHYQVDVWAFVADSLMCAWTAAEPDLDLHRRACLAALEASDTIADFDRERTGHRLPTRIGLHVGRVQVGPAGGGGKFIYNVTGDAANTAARIQYLNKLLSTRVLASEEVVKDIDEVLVRPVGDFKLPGKSHPIAVYEIVANRSAASSRQVETCALFGEALAAFRRHAWEEAAVLFAAVLRIDPMDGPSLFYIDQCRKNRGKSANEVTTTIVIDSK